MQDLDFMVLGQRRLAKIKQEAFLVWGAAKSGKTTLCKVILGDAMIGQRSRQDPDQTIYVGEGQFQEKGREETSSSLLPNVWQINSTTSLVEMPGLLAQRHYKKANSVKVFLQLLLQKLKKIRILLTIQQEMLHTKNNYCVFKMLNDLIKSFDFEQDLEQQHPRGKQLEQQSLYQHKKKYRELFNSIQIVVTHNTKPLEKHLSCISSIAKRLQQENEMQVQQKYKVIRLLQIISKNQRVRVFNKAEINKKAKNIDIWHSELRHQPQLELYFTSLSSTKSVKLQDQHYQITSYIQQNYKFYKEFFKNLFSINKQIILKIQDTIINESPDNWLKYIYCNNCFSNGDIQDKISKILHKRREEPAPAKVEDLIPEELSKEKIGQILLQDIQIYKLIGQISTINNEERPLNLECRKLLVLEPCSKLLELLLKEYLLLSNSQNAAQKFIAFIESFKEDIKLLHLIQKKSEMYSDSSDSIYRWDHYLYYQQDQGLQKATQFNEDAIQNLFPSLKAVSRFMEQLQQAKHSYFQSYNNIKLLMLEIRIMKARVNIIKTEANLYWLLGQTITLVKKMVELTYILKDTDQSEKLKLIKKNRSKIRHYTKDVCCFILSLILKKEADHRLVENLLDLLYIIKKFEIVDDHFQKIIQATEQNTAVQLTLLRRYEIVNRQLGRTDKVQETLLHQLHLYEELEQQERRDQTIAELKRLQARYPVNQASFQLTKQHFEFTEEDEGRVLQLLTRMKQCVDYD